jgi:hypothetical protein
MSGSLLFLLEHLRTDVYLRSGDYAHRIFLSSTGDFVVLHDWPVLCSRVFCASTVLQLLMLLRFLCVSLEGWSLFPRSDLLGYGR